MAPAKKVRTRYARPLQKRAGEIRLERKDLAFFGKCLVKFVKEEARKDASKSSQIPDTKRFFESFSYRVTTGGIEILSTWPWMEMIVEGTDGPFPMTWLTQEAYAKGGAPDGGSEPQGIRKGPLSDKPKPSKILRIPMRASSGEMVVRTAPLMIRDAWIHPGVAKHNFVNRAFRKAQEVCFRNWAKKGNLETVLAKEQAKRKSK